MSNSIKKRDGVEPVEERFVTDINTAAMNEDRISEVAGLPAGTDVLIVGFGPVGATLANFLGRYGINTVVIDSAPDMLNMPRAIGMDHEGLRILQQAGLEEGDFEVLGINKMHMISPYLGKYITFNAAGAIDGHARQVMYYQPDLEKALRHRLQAHTSVKTFASTELLTLEDQGDKVVAGIRQADGREVSLTAKYVIGADGANSAVRRFIGQDFKGQSYAEDWLIVDVKNSPWKLRDVDFYCGPGKPGPHIPTVGNRQRWEFMLGKNDDAESILKEEKIHELLAPWARPEEIEIERKAVYRFHARSCDNYSVGRVFLAGDAAHITPPFIGQGLVSGMRDAVNLCWKLAWVLKGHADPGILPSYDIERRPHAKHMINLARFLGYWIMPQSPLRAFLIHGTVRLLRFIPPVRQYLDEAKIKPFHVFKKGLFRSDTRTRNLRNKKFYPGSLFPQSWVRTAGKDILLSDDVLGDHFSIVGFGVDPRTCLDERTISEWRAIGGNFVQIARRSQYLDRADDAIEDLTGELVPGAAPDGWVAVVRPDKTVLHEGPLKDVKRLIRESREVLGLSSPHEVSIPLTAANAGSHS